jgi:mono/diheme cytochrome c family protein
MDHDQGWSGRTASEAAIGLLRKSLLTAVALFSATAVAQDEHSRRLGAELMVMAGDVRRLLAGEGGTLEREGLASRLRGAASSLPLLMRRADASPAPVADLRRMIEQKRWPALAAALARLRQRHPFDAAPMLMTASDPEAIAVGGDIHREVCAACHSVSWGDSQMPAKNLSAQLASMPREEFAARLLLGVRGDQGSALANPFSERELAGLIGWYSRP